MKAKKKRFILFITILIVSIIALIIPQGMKTDIFRGMREAVTEKTGIKEKVTVDLLEKEFKAPANVRASDGSYVDKVHIIWDSVWGAEKYYIYRSKTADGTYQQIGITTSTYYNDTQISNKVVYYYKVRAYNSMAGFSEYSGYDSGYCYFPPPQNVDASDGMYFDKVVITWDSVNGADKYYIYRSKTSDGTYKQIGITTATYYNDTQISNKVIYYYKVRAYNSSVGFSEYSGYDSGYRDFPAPQNVYASDGTYIDRVYLTWDSIYGADSYYIYRSKTADGTYQQIATTTSTYYNDTQISNKVIYYYKVRAYNSAVGFSEYSGYDSGYCDFPPPQNINASDGTYIDKVRITWDSVNGAERYYVYRSTNPNGSYTEIGNTTETYFDDTSPGDSTNYYKVRAYNSSVGFSEYSEYDSGYKRRAFKAWKVACGAHHTMAIKSNGTLWATGYNYYGQLGTGDTSNRSNFVCVLSNVSTVACGEYHTMAIKDDGTLWATGANWHGQLGTGDTSDRHSFVCVLSNVSAVACGYHTMAIKDDGTLWATGWNKYGQLGTGDTNERYTFVCILSNVSAVACGDWQTMAIKDDGTFWATGYNGHGQFGTGDTNERYTFVCVLSNVSAVACVGYHTMAIKDDGTLWATGANWYGQLGTGDTSEKHTFVCVLSNVSAVACGNYRTIVIKSNSTLWATGRNDYGQLGTGDTSGKHTFVCVLSNVSAVACNGWQTMAIKDDGTLWATGGNLYGQLGLGDTTDRHTFTPVP